MSKALVFTDLHLHAHKDRVDRLQNCLDVLEWIFEQAEKHDVENIFFLGDLFHERAKIDVLNYLRTFEVFMKYMLKPGSKRQMYLLVGNHDMYHKERWDVNSVKPLTAIPNVHIVDKPTQMILGGRRIDWMPHTDNPVKELKKLKDANDGEAGDLLLGHMAVHGALLNLCFGTKADVIVEYDNDMVPVDLNVFADWPMTMLGHYHGAQQLGGGVEYVGSPLELTFGEAFQKKHIVLLDLATMKKKYIENDFSPKHLIVSHKDVADENYDLNGNFVRLSSGSMSHKELIDLKKQIADTYKVLSLDTSKEKKIDADQGIMENVRAVLLNIDQMLQTYVKERGVPAGLDEPKLHAAGKRCLDTTSL